VQASFLRDEGEIVCTLAFNPEAVRKIGFSPHACGGGVEVPVERLHEVLECLGIEAPQEIVKWVCSPNEGDQECGEDLCFELPNGLIICPR